MKSGLQLGVTVFSCPASSVSRCPHLPLALSFLNSTVPQTGEDTCRQGELCVCVPHKHVDAAKLGLMLPVSEHSGFT